MLIAGTFRRVRFKGNLVSFVSDCDLKTSPLVKNQQFSNPLDPYCKLL